MKAIDIQIKFYEEGKKLGYIFLEEGKVVREEGKETLFNMSAISEHIYLFDNLQLYDSEQGYYTKQLSYFSNKLDGVGINRLTNPMEVGLSLFMLNTKNPIFFLKNALGYLTTTLGLESKKIFVRCDSSLNRFANWYREIGIKYENIFEWNNLEKFHIGKHRPEGFYSYLYYKYLNGIVPLGAIAVLEVNKKYQFDVVYYLERLSLILEKKQAIWEISEIIQIVKLLDSFKINIINIKRFALFFRIFVFLVYGDLYYVSNKKHGSCLKKILRELGFLLSGNQFNKLQKDSLLKSAIYLLISMGYNEISEFKKSMILKNLEVINRYSLDISKRLSKVEMDIKSKNVISYERLKSEFGIYPEWIKIKFSNELENLREKVPIKERKSIRSQALGSDETIVDIKKLLQESHE
ncbi:hypothetical protein [Leptotrichia sp. OH3620_COT-345]|uniref:hypothetical protein n=1 Tax=Leptotrichia sp. OH3620_COT-345 TaxID=2491048 RepID=UPI0018F5910E|nr:hypothetical protein [Leptotrichia sp. OH3620_COT-345]